MLDKKLAFIIKAACFLTGFGMGRKFPSGGPGERPFFGIYGSKGVGRIVNNF